MQVTETNATGLKRELRVVLPATDLTARVERRIDEMKDRVQLKGFRKGKVPPAHLRKVFGRSLMAEVLQEAVEETTRKALTERNERPAMQPKVDLPEDAAEIESVIAGQADLQFNMAYEILPEFKVADLTTVALEKLVAEVTDETVDNAVRQIAERNVSYEAVADRAAEDGDRITVDFIGRIDGEAFEGGTAQDVQIVLGQGNFIAGFEDGLKGGKAGDKRTVDAHFPEDYSVEALKGRTAQFECDIKEVAAPQAVTIDDAFATAMGAENLEKLREAVRSQIAAEYEQVSRAKVKRQLLDKLDEAHDFELPPSLVDQEFEGMWAELQQRLAQTGKTFESEGKSEDDVRDEYKKLAERRVRLGLVIGQIGDEAKVEVTQDELRRALFEEARRYPGQERMVYEYFEKTPGAVARLRAPIFEEKVVDHMLSLAKPVEKTVSVEELTKPIEDDAALI